MVMDKSYEDRLDELIIGFSPTVLYEGQGIAEFTAPVGSIEGKITAHFDELGDFQIQMVVSTLNVEGTDINGDRLYWNLMSFFAGSNPYVINNPCESLILSTPQGRLLSNNVEKGYILEQSDTGDSIIRFFPLTLSFATNIVSVSKYFVFPLLNFIPESDAFFAYYGISFNFNQNLARIVPLTNFDDICQELRTGKQKKAITAFIVGSSVEEPIDIKNWMKLKFRDLIPLLSLAIGTQVGSPWLEIWDENRNLICRLHIRLVASNYRRGVTAFSSGLNKGGIGEFLSSAQNSSEFGKRYLRAAISQIILGGYHDLEGNIEDRMSHIFRGLDALCTARELKKSKEPEEYLGEELGKTVKAKIESFKKEIRGLLSPNSPKLIKEEIKQVMGRIGSARLKPSGYGKAILKLLDEYDLPDAQIIDSYVKANPTSFKYCADNDKSWASVISAYRGKVIHDVWFDWQDNPPDTGELIALTYHTRDVILRIILKLLNYDGEYTPSVWTQYGSNKTLDWVTNETPPYELGYGVKLNQSKI